MRTSRRACRVIAVIAAWTVAGLTLTVAAAQELKPVEKLLPEQTLVYLSVKNPAGQEAYERSALGKVLGEPEMKAFVDDTRKQYANFIEAMRQQIPFDPDIATQLLKHELSVAFAGLNVGEDGRMEPALVLSAVFDRAGDQVEPMLLNALQSAEGSPVEAPQPAFQHRGTAVKFVVIQGARWYYAFLGKRLVVSMSGATMRGVLDAQAGEGKSLADDPTFQAVMGRVGGADGTLSLYVNAQGLFQRFGMGIPADGRAFLAGLGAFQVRALGACSRFADGGMRDSLYLYVPGERMGILSPAGNPVDLELLRVVPKDAKASSLFRLDAGRLYDTILAAIGEADPDNLKSAQADIQEAEQKLGFRIKEDLLASLGTQFLLFQATDETVLMVEVKDKQKFSSCLDRLVELAEGKAQLADMDYKGAQIRHLVVTGAPLPVAPSWTYRGNYAVIGLYPQTLKGFLARVEKGGPSILDNADFQRVNARFLKGCDAVCYQDIGGQLADFYSLLTILSPMLHAVPNADVKPELLPHPSVLRPYMFGLGSGCINDKEGILYEAFSPVGAAGGVLALAGSLRNLYGVGTPNVAGAAVVGAMLLPALAKARTQARRTVCLGTLHAIGMAMVLYRNDHDEAWPNSLSDLHPDYFDSLDMTCPQDNNPEQGKDGLRLSYRYVGPLPADTDPMVIMVYDKKGNHKNGRNCLFLDTHCQFLDEATLHAKAGDDSLRASYDLVLKAYGDKLTDERKKQLQEFYEIKE